MISTTPEPEKIDQELSFENIVCVEQNSQFKDYILGSVNKKTLAYKDLRALQWRTHCAVYWECELYQQDLTWQRMFQANPKINLFPLCQEFFQKVKQVLNDEGFTSELFNHWLKKQKLRYPHRLAYQNIKLTCDLIQYLSDPFILFPHCPFEDKIPSQKNFLFIIFNPLYTRVGRYTLFLNNSLMALTIIGYFTCRS